MHNRMSDEELAEHFRKLYGKKSEMTEMREARGRMRLAAFIVVIGLMALVAVVICEVLFIARLAHAAEIVPSWAPAATTSADWLAILYILGLVILGGAIGISKFLTERNG